MPRSPTSPAWPPSPNSTTPCPATSPPQAPQQCDKPARARRGDPAGQLRDHRHRPLAAHRRAAPRRRGTGGTGPRARARHTLFHQDDADGAEVSWADALVTIADRALAARGTAVDLTTTATWSWSISTRPPPATPTPGCTPGRDRPTRYAATSPATPDPASVGNPRQTGQRRTGHPNHAPPHPHGHREPRPRLPGTGLSPHPMAPHPPPHPLGKRRPHRHQQPHRPLRPPPPPPPPRPPRHHRRRRPTPRHHLHRPPRPTPHPQRPPDPPATHPIKPPPVSASTPAIGTPHRRTPQHPQGQLQRTTTNLTQLTVLRPANGCRPVGSSSARNCPV